MSSESHPSTILIVDDEPLIRQVLEVGLRQRGYVLLQASDGDEALDTLASRSVDLVLIDLVMPRREGIETIMEIRERFPLVKVIALSGAFGGQFLQLAQGLGAHAVLRKPVRGDVLRNTVATVLTPDVIPPAGDTEGAHWRWIGDRGSGIRDQGSGIRSQGPRPETEDQRPETGDQRPETEF